MTDPVEYFTDLSNELRAVQNRIRHFIGEAHWPTDGAWKESVLRAVLRRYLPPSYTVGSGFILTPEGVSTQIDVLVCDDSAPFLFRDGDFLITPADCVRAAVEVKTSLTTAKLQESLRKLDDVSTLMRCRAVANPFLGLFCYERLSTHLMPVLGLLQDANDRTSNSAIAALCFGNNQFCRFWWHSPRSSAPQPYNSWEAYDIPEIAPGYFVHNLVESIFPKAVERAESIWYPERGKDWGLVDTRQRRHYLTASSSAGRKRTRQPIKRH